MRGAWALGASLSIGGCFEDPDTVPAGTESDVGSTAAADSTGATPPDSTGAADGSTGATTRGGGTSGSSGSDTTAGDTADEDSTGMPPPQWAPECAPPDPSCQPCGMPLAPNTACQGPEPTQSDPGSPCAGETFSRQYSVVGLDPGPHRFSLLDPAMPANSADTSISISAPGGDVFVSCLSGVGPYVAPAVDIVVPKQAEILVTSPNPTLFPVTILPLSETCPVHPACCMPGQLGQCPDLGLTACVATADPSCGDIDWHAGCVATAAAVCGAACPLD